MSSSKPISAWLKGNAPTNSNVKPVAENKRPVRNYTLHPGYLVKCPRCGERVVSIRVRELEDGRKYYMAYHKGGKTCWLGADQYKYVEGLNQLDLMGLYVNIPGKYARYAEKLIEGALSYADKLPANKSIELLDLLIGILEDGVKELKKAKLVYYMKARMESLPLKKY